MPDRIFLDTNILIYAHDLDAGSKHRIALRIIRDLWEKRAGILSNQVLQEFYVNVTRKIRKPLSPMKAREIIRSYTCWQVQESHPMSIIRASEIGEEYNLSFWDALIVVAACEARADNILTEDLSSGQVIEGILIENPFTKGV